MVCSWDNKFKLVLNKISCKLYIEGFCGIFLFFVFIIVDGVVFIWCIFFFNGEGWEILLRCRFRWEFLYFFNILL